MIGEPYSPAVRALFEKPLHAGSLGCGYCASVADQGLKVELFAAIDGHRISALRFRAWGCPHVIAAAEAFCVDYEGRPISDLESFLASGLMQSLSVPVEKSGRILVLEDAVRALGRQLRETPTLKAKSD